MSKAKGFTLIELLIVVAIIAILAAIAIPNFLAAQVRAKVSRVKGEFSSLATALESYYVDNNGYPSPDQWLVDNVNIAYWYLPNNLTTPISYISSNKMTDPFRGVLYPGFQYLTRYRYKNFNDDPNRVGALRYGKWRISSGGPDKTATFDSQTYGWFEDYVEIYDPTNGTVSNGDIVRCQKWGAEAPEFKTSSADY